MCLLTICSIYSVSKDTRLLSIYSNFSCNEFKRKKMVMRDLVLQCFAEQIAAIILTNG